MKTKKTRIIKAIDYSKILYIKHLGEQPYNEIKFDCGKTLIVSYSLNYWQTIFQDFQRINKGILINPKKVVSPTNIPQVVLSDNSTFHYSRRKFKNSNKPNINI